LAVHAVVDPKSDLQNMARGQTYLALTDGNRFMQSSTATAGRGQYDRIRMTLAAIDLLRTALLEQK
jgi:hypothetical protein